MIPPLPNRLRISLLLLMMSGWHQDFAAGQDWPAFGGLRGNFKVDGPKLGPADFQFRENWQVESGTGKSALVIVGDRVFAHSRLENPESSKPAKYRESVAAFAAATGEKLWEHQDEVTELEEQESFSGDPRAPQSTPLVDDRFLVTIGFTGLLNCLDCNTGKLLWQKRLVEDFQVPPVQFGFAASPLVHDGRLLVHAGGEAAGLLCFEFETGELVWQSGTVGRSYASPVLLPNTVRSQLLLVTRDDIRGVCPVNGSLLWQFPLPEPGLTNVPSPLVVDGNTFLVSGQGLAGTRALSVEFVKGTWQVRENWVNRKAKFFYCNWLLGPANTVIGCDEDFMLALSAADGRSLGKWRSFGDGNLIGWNEQLICLGGRGSLSLLDIGEQGLNQVAEVSLSKDRCWVAPSVSGKALFVRQGNRITRWELAADGTLVNRLTKEKQLKFLQSMKPAGDN